jgi:hypothetical protein
VPRAGAAGRVAGGVAGVRVGGADRASRGALRPADDGVGHTGGACVVAVPASGGFNGVVRGSAGRGERRSLHGAGRGGRAEGSGLPAGLDGSAHAVGRVHGDGPARLLEQPDDAPGGADRPGPRAGRAWHGGGRVRAAAGLWEDGDPSERAGGRAVGGGHPRPGGAALAGRRVDHHRAGDAPVGQGRGSAGRGSGHAGTAIRHRRPGPLARACARPRAGDGRVLEVVGRRPDPARRAHRPGASERAAAQGVVLRADRGHPGRGHDEPARADRRGAQLGLSVLLAAGRGDGRRGAGRARQHRRGRAVPGLGDGRG